MLKRLLGMIKCTKTYIRKSEMCSGDEFRITLTYKGKKAVFRFHDNYLNKSDKSDFIRCLLLDSEAYENARNIYDFMSDFGYENIREAKRIYKACENQSERVHRLFNEQEIQVLSTIE